MMKLSFAGASIAEINGSILAYAAALALDGGAHVVDAGKSTPPAPPAPAPAPSTTGATAAHTPVVAVATAPVAPATTSDEVDAAGVRWSADKHAGTKAKVKSGLWRMKVGVTRPAGEGEDSPNYKSPDGAAPASVQTPPPPPGAAATPPPPPPPPAPVVDPNRPTDATHRHDNGDGTEQWFVNGAWDGGVHPIPGDVLELDDEFAAFRAAATTGAAAGERTWTDADLSQLLNQTAQKVGDVSPVKAIIAKYVAPGGQGHSREIPTEKREAFAQEIESTFGIQYASA